MKKTPRITVPGFRFAGVSCGIKKSKKKDLALIFSERPATAAALFTTNQVKAAPVLVGMERIRRGKIQAVVINSGNANACTGARGLRDALAMCRAVGLGLKIDPELVFPSSTGVIGVRLPMKNVYEGVDKAVGALSANSFSHAAEAILTTDQFAKVASTSCIIGKKRVRIAGMVKGAGMIAPQMATMLAYILTDAAIEPRGARSILRRCAEETFNCVTVDGDMSTNDTVLLLANGMVQNRPIGPATPQEKIFATAVREMMKQLAINLVQDGEGATKVVEIRVEGARSTPEAKKVASAVANSQLVKTAFFGEDPNFGRILAAVGYAGVPLQAKKLRVSFDDVTIARNGVGLNSREREAARVLKQDSFTVRIRLGDGPGSASVWTSDLSYEYIRINSAYRT